MRSKNQNLRRSARLFTEIVWPALGPMIGGGKYVSLESKGANGLRYILDTVAGVDGFQVQEEQKLVRGIASRVQRVYETPYNTFTIRYHRANGADTEWIKRLRALNGAFNEWLIPTLTVQAYIARDNNRLLSAAAVPTKDLYGYAVKWLEKGRIDRLYTWANWHDKNQFLVIPWKGLEAEGIPLKRWPDVGALSKATSGAQNAA